MLVQYCVPYENRLVGAVRGCWWSVFVSADESLVLWSCVVTFVEHVIVYLESFSLIV